MDPPIVVDPGLARIVSYQASAVRRFFEEQDFLEIFVPHLTTAQTTPFRTTFQVSSPETNFVGALRVSAGYYLAQTISQLHRTYTLSTSFRADPAPGEKLAEFQLLQAWSEGGLADAQQLAEDLLSAQIKAVLRKSATLPSERARQLRAIAFPLRSVTYEEAIRQTGLESDLRLTPDVAKKIVETLGSQPIFVTHLPENVDHSFTDIRMDRMHNHLGFVLLAPFAGNFILGGELETDFTAMSEQVRRSAFQRELVRLGGDGTELESYIQAISRLATPHYQIAGGFERVTQFLLGAERIEDATLLPVRASEQTIDQG
jgi:aspartyl/asparaginyl-tRNA synthetase